MNHLALQRVMVRMLYDANLAARVQADPAAALPEVELSGRERSWLTTPDPRAWTADPERGARSLTVLVQQYPVSMALAFRAAGSLAPFLDYFQSRRFHACIQNAGSMAIEFAEHLGELVDRGAVDDTRVRPLARLEQAVARLQRTAPARPPRRDPNAAVFRLSPDTDLVRSPAGTAELHAAVHHALGAQGGDLTEAVLDRSWRIPARKIRSGAKDPLLLELFRDDGPRVRFGVGVSGITEELFTLFDFARNPRARGDLIEKTLSLGAGADEAAGIISGLIEDATLVADETRPQ